MTNADKKLLQALVEALCSAETSETELNYLDMINVLITHYLPEE